MQLAWSKNTQGRSGLAPSARKTLLICPARAAVLEKNFVTLEGRFALAPCLVQKYAGTFCSCALAAPQKIYNVDKLGLLLPPSDLVDFF